MKKWILVSILFAPMAQAAQLGVISQEARAEYAKTAETQKAMLHGYTALIAVEGFMSKEAEDKPKSPKLLWFLEYEIAFWMMNCDPATRQTFWPRAEKALDFIHTRILNGITPDGQFVK